MIDATARGAWSDLETKLRPFIARRLRIEVDVDDVLQDVFLRMQRGVGGLRDDQRFGAWVYQVARSAIVDHHRRQAKHPLAQGERVLPDEGEVDTLDEGAAAQELARYMAVFVALLPSPYREALTLTELEGLTHKQAADMLGISVSGVKSRVQRGRAQLRKALEACCQIAVDARGHVVTCEARPGGCSATGCCASDDASPSQSSRASA